MEIQLQLEFIFIQEQVEVISLFSRPSQLKTQVAQECAKLVGPMVIIDSHTKYPRVIGIKDQAIDFTSMGYHQQDLAQIISFQTKEILNFLIPK